MGVTLEQLKEAMDAYGDLKMRIEGRKSERDTAIDALLARHPEIRIQVEDIRESYDDDMAEMSGVEKSTRKVLDSMIDSYLRDNEVGNKEVIKSKLLTVTATVNTTYDSVGLDGFALGDPRILGFRKQEVKKVVRMRPLGS